MIWDMRCEIWDERRMEDKGDASSHITHQLSLSSEPNTFS